MNEEEWFDAGLPSLQEHLNIERICSLLSSSSIVRPKLQMFFVAHHAALSQQPFHPLISLSNNSSSCRKTHSAPAAASSLRISSRISIVA